MIFRITSALFAIFLLQSTAMAQSAFDPEPVAYVLCVTNETKRLALLAPQIAKDSIIEQAFRACGEDEKLLRKSLADKGINASEAAERLSKIQKFIRQTAPDDIDRFRINRVPER